MKKLACLFFVWAAFTAVGCNAVFTPHPMGDEPVLLKHDEWEGTWTNGDDYAVFKVLDAEMGILRIAWIEDSQGQLQYETQDVYLRNVGDHMFASIKDKESYIWVKVKKEGEQIVAWDADLPKFKTMVREEKLPGRINDSGDVILEELKAEHVNLIASESEGVLFDWRNPSVAIRIIK